MCQEMSEVIISNVFKVCLVLIHILLIRSPYPESVKDTDG